MSRAPRRRDRAPSAAPDPTEIIEEADASLLDVIDNLLNKGVVVNGEVMLSLAGVDLVYLRLSVLLCAADRIGTTTHRPPQRGAPRLRRGAAGRRGSAGGRFGAPGVNG